MGKVIYWELCKKFKFDHLVEMVYAESVLEYDTRKIIWDFKIQTDHLIPARRPDLVIVNKKENLSSSGLCCPGGPQSENQRKWKERKVLKLCPKTEKIRNKEVTVIPIINNALGTARLGDWKSWASDYEPIPSKQEHYKDRPEYWEES